MLDYTVVSKVQARIFVDSILFAGNQMGLRIEDSKLSLKHHRNPLPIYDFAFFDLLAKAGLSVVIPPLEAHSAYKHLLLFLYYHQNFCFQYRRCSC